VDYDSSVRLSLQDNVMFERKDQKSYTVGFGAPQAGGGVKGF
jgi:hypothetical protein